MLARVFGVCCAFSFVVFRCIVLCCIVLYCVVLYCVMLCCIVLCSVVLWCVVVCRVDTTANLFGSKTGISARDDDGLRASCACVWRVGKGVSSIASRSGREGTLCGVRHVPNLHNDRSIAAFSPCVRSNKYISADEVDT